MEVTIIIPTYNEAENLPELVRRIRRVASNTRILVVDDDSPDGTAQVASRLGCKVLTRKNKRGLSSAVVDGANLAIKDSDAIVVIDADLQHPPETIPLLLRELKRNDIVVASRWVPGGSARGWGLKRLLVSWIANLLALPLAPKVRDRTSGFFATRGANITEGMNTKGFKILLEVLVRSHADRLDEVPVRFGQRLKGTSKFTPQQVRDYLVQLAQLYLHKFRWLRFGLVGLIGVAIHFILLYTLTEFAGLWYLLSAVLSIVVASTNNYFLNHLWTFKEHQSNIRNHLLGWIKYQGVSGITDALYIGILALFVEVFGLWYMLGAALSVTLTFVVKFKVAQNWIWGKRSPFKLSSFVTHRDPKEASYEWCSYYTGSLIQRWWKRAIAKTVWSFIPHSSTLLDVGCGSSPILSNYEGAYGVDSNPNKLAFLQEKLPSLSLKVADACSLPFVSESFDNVVCIEVIEHLTDPGKVIAEIARVLRRGGRAVIATPDYTKWLWKIAEKFTPYKEEHVFRFSRDSLEEMCFQHSLIPRNLRYIARCDLVELFEKV